MSENLITAMLLSAAVIAIMMIATWLVSFWRKDVSIVDIVWGTGFAAVAWTLFLTVGDRQGRNLLLPFLTTIWAIRLSVHLAVRNHGKPEDFRYQAMRQRWGTSFPVASLFIVFGLQGTVMWIVSLPLHAGIAVSNPQPVVFRVIGLLLWATGMYFEAVGDWQLARFKRDSANSGQVLETGLWRYTRHPNYFGDFLVWWGLFLVAASQSGAWWIVIGPLTMSILLMRVSGVTLLEKALQHSKPDYADYVSRTNAFCPGIPRKKSSRSDVA